MVDNPQRYGFRPHKGRFSMLASMARPFVVATGYQASADPGGVSVDLNIGDPVKLVSTGTVELCEAGAVVYGIVISVKPYWDGRRMQFGDRLPGATAWGTVWERRSQVLVIPATAGEWEVDVDDIVTATDVEGYLAFIGENCDHVFAPDSTLKKAFPKLDIAGHGTATAQWRIQAISGTAHNQNFAEDNVKLVVVPNETREAPFQTTGV